VSGDAVSDAPVFVRAANVVWRIAPDRVLVRHVVDGQHGGDSGVDSGVDSAADLMGAAALVWVALDEPATAVQIVERLGREDFARPVAEIADVAGQLVDAGWAARASPVGDT
jgi:hypothetical protein